MACCDSQCPTCKSHGKLDDGRCCFCWSQQSDEELEAEGVVIDYGEAPHEGAVGGES